MSGEKERGARVSLLVKGMNMPKYNGEHKEFDRYGCYLTVYKNGKVELHICDSDYNVIEIPTPHGRLIDSDKFLETNKEFADRDFIHPKYEATLRELIDEAPTILSEEKPSYKDKLVNENELVYPFMANEDSFVKIPPCFLEYAVSVDYGTVNPCSAGLWGYYKDSWYRIDEYFFDSRVEGYQRTDEEHYNAICQMIGDREIKEFIIDPSAASFIEIVRRKQKFNVVVATIGNIHSNIKFVYDSLKNGKIKICKSCKNAKREFSLYKWETNRYGVKVPVKANDHTIDDIHYFTATVSNLHLARILNNKK